MCYPSRISLALKSETEAQFVCAFQFFKEEIFLQIVEQYFRSSKSGIDG